MKRERDPAAQIPEDQGSREEEEAAARRARRTNDDNQANRYMDVYYQARHETKCKRCDVSPTGLHQAKDVRRLTEKTELKKLRKD